MSVRFDFISKSCQLQGSPSTALEQAYFWTWEMAFDPFSSPVLQEGRIYFDIAAQVIVKTSKSTAPSILANCRHTCMVFGNHDGTNSTELLGEAVLCSAHSFHKAIIASLGLSDVKYEPMNAGNRLIYPELRKAAEQFETILTARVE